MNYLDDHPHSPTRADEREPWPEETRLATVSIDLQVEGSGYEQQMRKAKEIRDYILAKYPECEAAIMAVDEQ